MRFRITRTSASREDQPHPRAVPGDPLDIYPWTIEVASLEDLLSLYDGEMIVNPDNGRPSIELYDDYRE